MSLLHIVNKSPFERNSLDSCLRLAKKDSAILLIEDGIYAILNNSSSSKKMSQALSRHSVYALRPDIEARGIDPDKIIEGISLIDYDGFVKLTTECSNVQSWL